MPELPEVETVVRTLAPGITGRQIGAVRLIRKDIVEPATIDFPSLVQNRTIRSLSRRGKKIVVELDNDSRFYIHLGMSGRLTLDPPAAPFLPHTHMVLAIAGAELRFVDPRRFGGIFWLEPNQSPDAGLGPEPLALKARDLAPRLAKTRRAIKTALLDQRLIAGIGNIYADEALFESRINPRIPANRLSSEQIARLSRAIKKVLTRAIKHRGSTLRDYRDANGNPGNFQTVHRVYDREGKACPRCGTPIRRIVLGGRSTHFCPKCQARRR
jgi:formamidopyrimidine-DNA glycosylase